MTNNDILSTPLTDTRLYRFCLLIARLGLAYLFFTQLWWKLPPNFGCANDFAFPQPAETNYWTDNGSSGLCYWMGLESVFASQDRRVLVADMRSAGLPNIGINIRPVAQLNALLLDNIVIPNIRLFGWVIWLAEFWIFMSMLLGLYDTSRRAGLHRRHRPVVYRSGEHPAPIRVGMGVWRDTSVIGGAAGGRSGSLSGPGCLAASAPRDSCIAWGACSPGSRCI